MKQHPKAEPTAKRLALWTNWRLFIKAAFVLWCLTVVCLLTLKAQAAVAHYFHESQPLVGTQDKLFSSQTAMGIQETTGFPQRRLCDGRTNRMMKQKGIDEAPRLVWRRIQHLVCNADGSVDQFFRQRIERARLLQLLFRGLLSVVGSGNGAVGRRSSLAGALRFL